MIVLVLLLHVHCIGMITTFAFFKVFFHTIIIQQRKSLLASLQPLIFAIMSSTKRKADLSMACYMMQQREKSWKYKDEQLLTSQSMQGLK